MAVHCALPGASQRNGKQGPSLLRSIHKAGGSCARERESARLDGSSAFVLFKTLEYEVFSADLLSQVSALLSGDTSDPPHVAGPAAVPNTSHL